MAEQSETQSITIHYDGSETYTTTIKNGCTVLELMQHLKSEHPDVFSTWNPIYLNLGSIWSPAKLDKSYALSDVQNLYASWGI